MVDETVLRDLLDGKITPEEVDDPNIVSLIERIYGAEALEKLGLRQADSAPRSFSEPVEVDVVSVDSDVEGSTNIHTDEGRWGPRWSVLILGILTTAILVFNIYVGVGTVIDLCESDSCGETYTLGNAPELESSDSWRETGTLTNEDIIAISTTSIIAVIGLTGRYR
ncbi:MAG: hypothetical protein CMB75_04605 [Euryarchaeota archaeon]|nr:hypothetical protein [Euryarchaeota archaeon]|tara:strand:+ start:393 stop:893 length:501 start_codon:yes stop_codon:yes gene_type:complete